MGKKGIRINGGYLSYLHLVGDILIFNNLAEESAEADINVDVKNLQKNKVNFN